MYWGHLTLADLVLVPLVSYLAYTFALAYQRRKQITQPEYRYFTLGLMLKLLGSQAAALVYDFYYYFGDTLNYNHALGIFNRLLWERPDLLSALFNGTAQDLNFTDLEALSRVGISRYFYSDSLTFMVRLFFPFSFIAGGSFYLTSLLTALLSFFGIWALYRFFVLQEPALYHVFAIGVLVFPSVWFWGSGIFKDTITLAAVGVVNYSSYSLLLRRQSVLLHLVLLIVAAFLILKIKAYILAALGPFLVAYYAMRVKGKVHNPFIRALIAPFLLFGVLGMAIAIPTLVGSFDERFSLENSLTYGRVVQRDLYYNKLYYTNSEGSGSSFYIGDYTPTPSGILPVLPAAITAGLFRPFLWEARSAPVFAAALESLAMLWLFGVVLVRLGIARLVSSLVKKPLLLMCLGFSLMFALALGLSTANFGTLVRYKIPLVPFYVVGMVYALHLSHRPPAWLYHPFWWAITGAPRARDHTKQLAHPSVSAD